MGSSNGYRGGSADTFLVKMKILVQGTNWVGDAIMSIPAMRKLRHAAPDAEITLHTREWAEGVFRDVDFLDAIISYARSNSTFTDAISQAKLLRKKHFDAAIIFPNSFVSAFTARLARIPRRFGYATDGRRVLLSDPLNVPDWKGKRHEVFYYSNLVDVAIEQLYLAPGQTLSAPDISLDISSERRDSARRFLVSKGVSSTKPTIALGVGSANSRAKRWPAESYAKLNDYCQIELNANVILMGAANETDVAAEVTRLSKYQPIDLSGKTSLEAAAAVLSEVDLLISNDMGLTHVAPAVGTRTFVIFGPTDPETTRPYSENVTVIRKMVECSPCMLRDCPIDHRCMTRVSVEDVFDQAKIAITDEAFVYGK